MTLQQFIDINEVTLRSTPLSERTDKTEWLPDSRHYACTIRANGKSCKVQYSMGSAHTDPPNLKDLLECLQMDCSAIDQPFESWANDLGYSTDSIKALKTYNLCKRTYTKLSKVLPMDQFLACEVE